MKTAIVNIGPILSGDWHAPSVAVLSTHSAWLLSSLVLLGRLRRAVVRPPLMKLSAAEIELIRQALVAAGLPADTAVAKKQASLV